MILVSGFISDFSGAPYVPLPKKSLKGILGFAEINPERNREGSPRTKQDVSRTNSFVRDVEYVRGFVRGSQRASVSYGVKNSQNLYDLGSGDGRILIEAVRGFGVEKGIGYEISPWPYLKAKFLISRADLKDKIRIFRQDFSRADLSKANIIFIYLYPKIVQKLASKFSGELKPGAKIISVSFLIESPGKFNFRLIKQGKVDKFNVYLYEKM